MPDKREHRGRHPADDALFAEDQRPRLREAVGDLSWLLGRDYARDAALKLVGDRYSLRQRQRLAVMRSACRDEAARDRQSREVGIEGVGGRPLWIDGYNVLLTIEAALAGGVLLLGRDGCLRDLASVHGSYRKVEETVPALERLGEALAGWGVRESVWYLDKPVSNSGRLKTLMGEVANSRGWDWSVRLVNNPDAELARAEEIVATADSAVLDRCGRWLNLARRVVGERVEGAGWVDLG